MGPGSLTSPPLLLLCGKARLRPGTERRPLHWVMTKKKAGTTSPNVAKVASKLLADPKTPPPVKKVAASALSNTADKLKGKKK